MQRRAVFTHSLLGSPEKIPLKAHFQQVDKFDMQSALIRLLLSFLLAANLIAADSNLANETAQRFENTNHQFAITLNADWKEVEAKTAPYAKEVVDLSDDTTCLAYQLASETNFAALVFIQIDNKWRVPEFELARLQVDFLRRKFLTERLEVEGLLDSSYDTNTHVLRISSATDMPGAGKVRLLEAVHFTDKGSFIVSCVAPGEHFRLVGTTFARALDTFHIDPSLAYRPRANAERPVAATGKTGRVRIRFGFIFAICSVALFVARWFGNRVMSDEV